MTHSSDKGKRGEREVVAMWRAEGFLGTMRTPGSGGLRSYGAGSPSPFPGDIIVKRTSEPWCRPEPWLVEVKYDEKVAEGGVRTWQGSTFIMATLRDLEKESVRTKVIGRQTPKPVLFARAARVPWSVWVRPFDLFAWDPHGSYGTWMQIPTELFFEQVVE